MRFRFKKTLFIAITDIAVAITLVALGWYWIVNRVGWDINEVRSPLTPNWSCDSWMINSSALYFKFWESFPPSEPNWTIEIIGTETGAVVMVRKFERPNDNNRVTGLMWCWTVEIDRDEWHNFLRSLYNSGIREWEGYYDGGIRELKRCCRSRGTSYELRRVCCDRLDKVDNLSWHLHITSATAMYASDSNIGALGTLWDAIGGTIRKIKHTMIYDNLTPLVYSHGEHKRIPNWEGFQSVIGDFRAKIMQKTDAKLKCEDYEMKNRCVAVCAE